MVVLASSFSQAQTWTGGGANNSWTTSDNWSGGVPANNGTANLTFSGSVRPITQADTAWAVSGLSFSAGAAAFILNGSDLTIGTGGITNSSSNRQTVDKRITLSAVQTWNAGSEVGGEMLIENAIGNGGFTLTVAGTNAVTIEGAVSGAGGIVKSGVGTLTFGSASNSYGGGTELSEGIVSVGANGALGNAAGTLFFKGGTLEITGTTFTSTARAISWGTGGGGFKVADASNTFTVGQSLSGSGVLSKTGPGTLVLSGTNTYTGQTTVSEGTLRLAGGNAIANNGTVSLAHASGVSLDLNNTSETVGTISGGGLSGGNINLGSGTPDLPTPNSPQLARLYVEGEAWLGADSADMQNQSRETL